MRVLRVVLLASIVVGPQLTAQPGRSPADSLAVSAPRWLAGLSVDIGQPVGAFRRAVKNGAGMQAHVLLRLDGQGRASVRLQGGWLNYGHESQRLCLANTPGCRVAVNVATVNGILSWGVGPQLSLPIGPLRAFGFGLVGVSRMATVSGISGGLVPDIVAGDENFGDSGLALSGGLGLQLPVRRTTSIDVGVAYQGNGRRAYLLRGGVTDRPDGTLAFDVKRSAADLIAFRVGVTSAIPWGRRKPAP